MTTSLDVSHKLDQVSVDLLLAVDSVAVSLGVSYCIVGAFARDVVLGLCFGIDTGEATRDIDFGLMMDDWAQFDEFRARLMANKEFAEHVEADYPILADATKEIAKAYGVLGVMGLANRWTFYIGPDGKIVYIEKSVKTSTAGQDVAAKLSELGVAKK